MSGDNISAGNIGERANVAMGSGASVNVTNIIQQAQAYTPGALHQLRSIPREFTGRTDELDALVKQLRARARAAIGGVEGMGGIGKTELANLAAHALAADFPDAQLFVELGAHSLAPLTTAQALTFCMRAFISDVNAKLPDDERALGDLYRDVLTGKRALIVLDDARDDAQVRALLPPSGCAVIVTSRRRLETVPQLSLPTLPRADAIAMLIAIAPRLGTPIPNPSTSAKGAEQAVGSTLTGEGSLSPSPAPRGRAGVEVDFLNDLAAACGDLPIALTVAGGLLNARKSLSVQDYLRDLRARGLDALSSQSQQINVNELFAYSYCELSDAQQAAWRALAVMPSDFDRTAGVAVIGDAGAHTGAPLLDDLVMFNLLDYDAATERFRWHDLLQQFANKQLPDAERAAAQRRHAGYYADVIGTANQMFLQGGDALRAGLALYDLEATHIHAGQTWAAMHADADDDAARLCSWYGRQGSLLGLRLRPRDYIGWLNAALSAARRVKDREAEGAHLSNLGGAYHKLGDARQAITYYGKQLTIVREIGDRHGEGADLGNLGNAYADLGDARQAITYYEQQLTIAREIGNRRGEGDARGNLGNAYCRLGNVGRAIAFYVHTLFIDREIGDRRGEGKVLGNLGNAYHQLGDARRAIAFYEQALVIDREIGDRSGEGTDLWNKALVLDTLGERAQAIAHAAAALQIFEAIEDPWAEKVREQLAAWHSTSPPSPLPQGEGS